MKEERFLHPGRPPHQWGDQPGQKGSFRTSEENAGQKGSFRTSEENAAAGLMAASAVGRLHRWSAPPPGTPQPETHVRQCRRVLELGLWRSDLGRGLGLAVQKQPGGAEIYRDCT